MADTRTSIANKPAWVDLSTPDPAAARDYYSRLFGWEVVVNDDPQYGGYAMARVDGEDVAGIGPTMAPGAPASWNLYIGSEDAAALADKVTAAGGTVAAPAFAVGDVGRMAVFRDPSGAFISAWEPITMQGFQSVGDARFGWAELSARGIDKAIPFYEQVFGWTHRTSPMGEMGDYTEFLLDGQSIAGGTEMNSMVPPEVPSYWLAYFSVEDVDRAFATATAAGGREMLAPQDFPGGRFAIVADPQGAAFGLLKMRPRG